MSNRVCLLPLCLFESGDNEFDYIIGLQILKTLSGDFSDVSGSFGNLEGDLGDLSRDFGD
jgi:hypothetical protein